MFDFLTLSNHSIVKIIFRVSFIKIVIKIKVIYFEP